VQKLFLALAVGGSVTWLTACCPCPGVFDVVGNLPIPNCFYCLDPDNRDPFVRVAPHASAPELQPRVATPGAASMAY
jgi:hypothetical protein